MRVAISTLAFLGQKIEEIIEEAERESYIIEFSSGLPYRSDMKEIYQNAKIERLPHNYFPAPEVPFVLNLASSDAGIREMSVDHCIQGLELAVHSKSPFYAAHAGFCIDPAPSELGHKLSQNQEFNREENWNLFISSVQSVLKEAQRLNIDFLIENNVVADFNIRSDGRNPLLCGNPDEIERLVHEIGNDRFGILLDTAHLKVSATVLGFQLDSAVRRILPYLRGCHHSDNEGKRDTNEPLTDHYWFLPYMPALEERTHVIEVARLNRNQIHEQKRLLERTIK